MSLTLALLIYRRSKVIHGDQNFFPVYEPDPNVLRAKYLEAEEESRQKHYDASKEGGSRHGQD